MRALDPRLLRRARAARVVLGVDAALGIATALVVLVQGTAIAWVVARSFDGDDAVTSGLVVLALAFAARAALAWLFEVAGNRAATSVLSELRLAVVERRLRTQPAALDGTEGAALATAAVQGVDGLTAYFARYLPQVVLACAVPAAVLVYVATIDLTSVAIMLATLPLVPVFMWLIGRYTEARTRERWETLQLLSTHFLDVVRGLPTLRAFNRAATQRAVVAQLSDRYRQATMQTLRVGFLSGSVLELAATLGVALVAVTIGVRLVNGGLGLQAGLTVLVLAPELYLPLRRLAAQFHASADGLAGAEQILALLDAPAEVASGGTRPAPSPADGPLVLERVSFAYPGRPALVLNGLDLVVQPGEMVGVVGESGAGKTTLATLLLRLAEPTAGCIGVGGRELADVDARAWRRRVAWAPQNPTLFRGTVSDNVRLGRPQAGEDDVRRAARLAGADAFVTALPSGYDTVVGDGGRPLSAGERRRLALARAFLQDAPLLILDEPTADLDDESAALVANAINFLRGSRTILVISHRPALLPHTDRVVRVEHGRAVELALNEAVA